jgi:predicted nucleotide-binding protein
MDNLLDELVRAARRCERAANLFEKEPLRGQISRLMDACDDVGQAWSGSFIGYQATVYIQGLRPTRPGEFFNREWGPSESRGQWAEYLFEGVRQEIERQARSDSLERLNEAVTSAQSAFESRDGEIIPALDAILTARTDDTLKGMRNSIANLRSCGSAELFAHDWLPGGQQMVRDPRALASMALQVPHHMRYKAWLMERVSYGIQAGELAKLTKQVVKYLRYTMNLKGTTVAKTDGRIFIGHGRSNAWRDLKDFLQDRLGLQWEEFNRESAAGFATKERLEALLDGSSFAFLVMTAEDEQTDGSIRARANVIHEVGLFQGRLGFERAIILLEDGCEEFSNIIGLGQIRFPKSNIMAKSEEIRRVLEREKII